MFVMLIYKQERIIRQAHGQTRRPPDRGWRWRDEVCMGFRSGRMERHNGKHYLLRSEKRLLDRRNVSTAAMRLVLTRLLGSSLPWSITVQLKINPRPFIVSCSSFLAAVYKIHDRKKCPVVSTSPQQHLVDSETCKQFKFKHQDLQMFGPELNYMSNFLPLEVVGRGSETQLKVCGNLYKITWREKGCYTMLIKCWAIVKKH